ncbi:site-specific DNA-methyltransferase (adenine-specific) [Lachnospiraceae bacterium]|nr:site-specific DNA-methyltransferase (adenine-specific) [Lachnospiraceae bacterium]
MSDTGKKQKAGKNKTIDFSLEEGQEYIDRAFDFDKESPSSEKKSIKEIELSRLIDKTILGDTFRVLRSIPKESVDLLIVDPPYNLDKDFNGKKFRKTGDNEYAEYTEQWILAVKPLLKKNASVYVCCDWLSSMVIGPLMNKHFQVRNRITWQREKGRGALTNWKNGMEDIWYATVSGDYQFHVEDVKVRRKVIAPYRQNGQPKDWEETGEGNFRNTYPSNFWDDISIPYWSMPENTAHPTQKPEKLLAKLILASSSEGDLVLDPFAGSGSTGVTAKKLGRHFIDIEQNPLYCAWAEKRLEMAEADNSIQGYTDGVFWERNTAQLQKVKRRAGKTE